MDISHIRNFCIIAHIDHGKSTLADRLIQITGAVAARDMKEQILDTMDIERERGITVKLQTVRLPYRASNGNAYQLNLVDTPGHVDFTAEVMRSLAACEAALLLVDATQGVQAQTIANLRLAQSRGMVILPVLNKIDSPAADVDRVLDQIAGLDGLDISCHFEISAKTGQGVEELLEHIARAFPAPVSACTQKRALVFDSHYDPYQGVILHLRVFDGTFRTGDRIRFMSGGAGFDVACLGAFMPQMQPMPALQAGEVGYLATGIKHTAFVRMGDTLTDEAAPATTAIAPYQAAKPMVFAGIYPDGKDTIVTLREGITKLALNDAAFYFEAETSEALGAGYRCGFLGMLHMEIVKERLEREYGVKVISTAPSVTYRIALKSGEVIEVRNPVRFPNGEDIESVFEPCMRVTITSPDTHLGAIMELCNARRGVFESMDYIAEGEVATVFEIPLAEMAFGFFDSLKSISHGYAHLDYSYAGDRASDLVRVDILIENEPVDAFSFVIHRASAYDRASEIVHRLKYVMPKKLYPVPLQAAIGNRVIAREDIPPLRKSALAQGFQGSISAKNQLIRKQKSAKGRAHGLSKNDIPQDAFKAILAT